MLCFCLTICFLLNSNVNVFASARSETFNNFNNKEEISTNFLTQEEIHDILEVNSVDLFNTITITPYLNLTLTYTDLFGNHTA